MQNMTGSQCNFFQVVSAHSRFGVVRMTMEYSRIMTQINLVARRD